eukprot:4060322-Prymnesium_polylepis.1
MLWRVPIAEHVVAAGCARVDCFVRLRFVPSTLPPPVDAASLAPTAPTAPDDSFIWLSTFARARLPRAR